MLRNSELQNKSHFLRQLAQNVFQNVLRAVDAEIALKKSVQLIDDSLKIADQTFPINQNTKFYAVAIGKAAYSMAFGLSQILGNRLLKGVISCPKFGNESLPENWEIFHGGHPVPNEESLAAAKAAFSLLKAADNPNSFIIYLISGGGSAMMELLKNKKINLSELQKTNNYLVNCGATIAEINAIRRKLSKIKGGGLSTAVNNAKQITLIVSDTNHGQAFNVASGPTILPKKDFSNAEFQQMAANYKLEQNLPKAVFELITKQKINRATQNQDHPYFVLLENQNAIDTAVKHLQENNCVVEIADDLVEAGIESGCAKFLAKLMKLREAVPVEIPVGVVSGGEFICPVRGNGKGGRNLEAALRTAILFNELKLHQRFINKNFAALFAGTDGIDGNSPAAGAMVDETTVSRARKKNLYPLNFLKNSDSFSFFSTLDEAIVTKPTGTNVRDIRLLLAF